MLVLSQNLKRTSIDYQVAVKDVILGRGKKEDLSVIINQIKIDKENEYYENRNHYAHKKLIGAPNEINALINKKHKELYLKAYKIMRRCSSCGNQIRRGESESEDLESWEDAD